MATDLFGAVTKDAVISRCGRYRYRLERSWGRREKIVWVMLNPSTADAKIDDPTIRRCIRFSQAWGYGGMVVVNLFAYRATDPRDLIKAADPIGPDNEAILLDARNPWFDPRQERVMVAAWGAHPFARDRAAKVFHMASIDWFCLGTTKDGFPRHPLYVKGGTQLTPYELPEAT